VILRGIAVSRLGGSSQRDERREENDLEQKEN